MPLLTSQAGPDLQISDLIAFGTYTDLSSLTTFTPDGSGGLTQAGDGAACFDWSAYRNVLIFLQGTWVNAVTVDLMVMPVWLGATSRTLAAYPFGPHILTSASGCDVMMVLGNGVPSEVNTGFTNQMAGASHLYVPWLPPFARLRLNPTAATGVITGGKLTVIGQR